MLTHGKNIKIFTGNSHPELAAEIAEILGLPVGNSQVSTFSDGEISVNIGETVRGADVFIVQHEEMTKVYDNAIYRGELY